MDLSLQRSLLDKHKSEFETYLNLLLKWNKTYNLTAITSTDEIWEKHFLDSLSPLPFLPENGSLLDVGSGAGFPGIPLKIVRPTLSITLIDSIRKKCNFCDAAIRELGLKDINVVQGRIEDKDIEDRLGKFDVVIARAVSSINRLILKAFPCLKIRHGIMIAMKGESVTSEIEDTQKLLDEYQIKTEVHQYLLPSSGAKHTIIVISSR